MTRSTKYTLKFSTNKKKNLINSLFDLYSKCLQETIDLMWDKKIPQRKWLSTKDVTWLGDLGGQWKQLVYTHASQIVRGCKARKGKKSKPEMKNFSINIDQKMVKVEKSGNSFDKWFRLRLPFIKSGKKVERIEILIPLKDHKHSLKFEDWELCKSIRLSRNSVTLIFEKEIPEIKLDGKILGLDQGFSNLITTSDGQFIGSDFTKIYNKISRKKQGSKAFKRALIERNNEINYLINKELDLYPIKELVVEDLKSVKTGINGKFRKTFNNKLQRWSYPKVMSKLDRTCEENRVLFTRVDPAYTSQTCSVCGFRDKNNRKAEKFLCLNCGYVDNSDHNAAINISLMGAYSPHV